MAITHMKHNITVDFLNEEIRILKLDTITYLMENEKNWESVEIHSQILRLAEVVRLLEGIIYKAVQEG